MFPFDPGSGVNPFAAYADAKSTFQKLEENKLNNIFSSIRNKYEPTFMKQKVTANDLANQMAGVNAQYLPREKQAQLAQAAASLNATNLENVGRSITNQYLPAKSQAEIEGMQAGAMASRGKGVLAQEQAKYLPEKLDIALQNAQARQQQLEQSKNRFSQAYQYSKMVQLMPTAARATFLADKNNLDKYNTAVQILADQMSGQAPPPGSNAGGSESKGAAPPQMLSSQQISPSAVQQPAGQQVPVQPQPGQAPLQNPEQPQQGGAFVKTPLVSAPSDMQRALEISANNALTTAPTRTQIEGAMQTEKYINSPMIQNQIESASKFAGIQGKGKAALDALAQQNPQDYENYLAFRSNTMPLLAGRIKTLEHLGATDDQLNFLNGMWKNTLDSWTSNPEQFKTQIKNYENALNLVAQSIVSSGNKIFNVDYGIKADVPLEKPPVSHTEIQFSESEINNYAKKHGMTNDQVIDLIRRKAHGIK